MNSYKNTNSLRSSSGLRSDSSRVTQKAAFQSISLANSRRTTTFVLQKLSSFSCCRQLFKPLSIFRIFESTSRYRLQVSPLFFYLSFVSQAFFIFLKTHRSCVVPLGPDTASHRASPSLSSRFLISYISFALFSPVFCSELANQPDRATSLLHPLHRGKAHLHPGEYHSFGQQPLWNGTNPKREESEATVIQNGEPIIPATTTTATATTATTATTRLKYHHHL